MGRSDLTPGDVQAINEKAKKVGQAADTLNDPQARAAYDKSL